MRSKLAQVSFTIADTNVCDTCVREWLGCQPPCTPPITVHVTAGPQCTRRSQPMRADGQAVASAFRAACGCCKLGGQERIMKYCRRQFLHFATATAALSAAPRLAGAQTYPL